MLVVAIPELSVFSKRLRTEWMNDSSGDAKAREQRPSQCVTHGLELP